MLIVIVIIGILIASLMPRMQSAQWRARDVARKNDLSQIQTAIITSQQDKWKWPQLETANSGMAIGSDSSTYTYHTDSAKLAQDLQDAWMTQVPTDPNGSNQVSGLWATAIEAWKYGYMVTKRNSVANWWFVLMAKTEVEWSSNWLVCDTCSGTNPDALKNCWKFTDKDVDLKNVVTCSSFTKGDTNKTCQMDGDGNCFYTDEWSLRYILVY